MTRISKTPDREVIAYACPECKQVSLASDWLDCEVGCEDCGSHPAKECPRCRDRIDLIYRDLEELADIVAAVEAERTREANDAGLTYREVKL